MGKFTQNLYNCLDFWLRNKIKFSKGRYIGVNEPKDCLFDDFSTDQKAVAEIKEQEFYIKYNLEKLKDNSTVRNYLENLYIIELLESYLDLDGSKKRIKVLDIGSKNWFYSQGEYSFFKSKYSDISMTGIELDAFRLYTDLHSRFDYAQYYIKDLENTRYIAGNLLDHTEKYDYITWFLPFITETPLLKWGLPLKYFKPDMMLQHAYNLLNRDGILLILNQGNQEYQIQQEILKRLSLSFCPKGLFESNFHEYENDRFVIILQRSEDN